MPPGLGASVWADGHGGRTAANKDRTRLENQIPIQTDSDTTTQPKTKNGVANHSLVPKATFPDAVKVHLNPSFDQSYKQPSSKMRVEREMTLPSAALDMPEGFLERAQAVGSPDITDTKSTAGLDPVEQYIKTLDLPSLAPGEFRMLELPYEERVYSVKLLCAMKNTRMHPKPFVNIPPGPFFEIRKGFKIANIAKAKGLSLTDAVEMERLGEIVVPDSPEWMKQGRRWRSPSPSSQYSETHRQILEPVAPPDVGCISGPSSSAVVVSDDESVQDDNLLLPSEILQRRYLHHSPRWSGRLTPYSDYVASLNLSRIEELESMKEDNIQGQTGSENSFQEVFESEKIQAQETEVRNIKPDEAELSGMKPEDNGTRNARPDCSETMNGQLREFKADSFSSLAEKDRRQLKQLLQDHIALEMEIPRTFSMAAMIDTPEPLVDSRARSIEVPASATKEALDQEIQAATNASISNTMTLIESLRRSADGDHSLQESLSLIEKSLLGQSPNAPNDSCGKSLEDTENPSLQTHSQPSKAVDHSVMTADAASSKVAKSFHQSQFSHTYSDTNSEISVEIIVDYQPARTEQCSRMIAHANQTSQIPVISSSPGDWQIEPNAQYDEVLPENQQLQCHFCNSDKQYKSMNKLINHWERKHYYCDKCHLTYAHREELIDHLIHGKREHNFCEECVVDFQSPDALISHCQKFHARPDDSINCPGCRARCNSAVEVVQHLESGLCPNISRQQFGQARVVTALIHRHGLGPIQDCSPDEKYHIEDQSLKLLRGDNCIVRGLPLVKESAWSPHFDADIHRVLNHGQQMYKCPYAGCFKHFRTDVDFIDHLQAGHFDHGICPGCFKEFKVASALLRHLMRGHRICKLARGPVFAYAIAAVSGSYIKAEAVDLFGNWKFVAGIAPSAELYMELPQVMGSSSPLHGGSEWW